jgi:hypothetical protein
LAAALIPSAALAREAPQQKIAVLELTPATDDDAKLAANLSGFLAADVEKNHPAAKIISTSDVKTLLDAAAQQALMACEDDRCLADHSSVLAADLLVGGQAGELDGQVMVFLALIRPQDARVVARAANVFTSKANAKREMGLLTKRLFHPDAAAAGDELLSDLRTALVFTEYDSEGKEMRRARIADCLRKQLSEAGATIVSPMATTQLRQGMNWREVMQTGVPEQALSTAEADVVIAGVADYEVEESPIPKDWGGGTKSKAAISLGLQVIRLDSGEVIVADDQTAVDVKPKAGPATRVAVKGLCKKLVPTMKKALEHRYARGERVVLDVKGSLAGKGAKRLVKKLEAMVNTVARVKVRRFDDKSATIDITVRGGDGVKLALALMKAYPAAKIDGSPGKVKLKG